MPQESNNKSLIIGIIIITVLIFGGLIWALAKAPADTSSGVSDENVSFSDENDPMVGSASSTVVVHIYGDFQCPACKSAEPGLQYAIEKYKDRVRFVWKDFPLMQLHPNARIASEAGRCAQAQGKFWEFHNRLYAMQDVWAPLTDPKPSFNGYATDVGLDASAFQTCLASQAEDAKVVASMSEGGRNQVDATPTFFVNQRRYFAMSPQEWDAAIKKAMDSN